MLGLAQYVYSQRRLAECYRKHFGAYAITRKIPDIHRISAKYEYGR